MRNKQFFYKERIASKLPCKVAGRQMASCELKMSPLFLEGGIIILRQNTCRSRS